MILATSRKAQACRLSLIQNALGKSLYVTRNFILLSPNLNVLAVGFARKSAQIEPVSLYSLCAVEGVIRNHRDIAGGL